MTLLLLNDYAGLQLVTRVPGAMRAANTRYVAVSRRSD